MLGFGRRNEEVKITNDYIDRYGIITKMGERLASWKNIDYVVASSKILDAEVELDIQPALEKTRFDKPKKWYKKEDADKIIELLVKKVELSVKKEGDEQSKKKADTSDEGKTRAEIIDMVKQEYGIVIWSQNLADGINN